MAFLLKRKRKVEATLKKDRPAPSSGPLPAKATEEAYGLFEFDEGTPSDALFDIIAVHGLGGHWKDTWTADNGKLWLRDFLPTQLATFLHVKARILSYGYNSNTAFSKAVTDINDEAEMLLDRVKGERATEQEKKRPIVFIAHSLGGILVKKAMIVAQERSRIYGELLDSIHSVIFFGTPHRGSDLAWWADFTANLLRALELGRGTNTNYIEALKRNSKEFSLISQQWVERSQNIEIRTYYETERLLGFLVVDKDSARLNLPNEIPVGVAGTNHKTMCKFEELNGQKYRQIWNAMKIIAAEIRDKQVAASNRENSSFELNEKHLQFLQSLSISDYKAGRRRNPEREEGTCEWILEHEQYKAWMSKETSDILWISGDPGCGKSVAASFLVDQIRGSAKETLTAFFFFKDDSDRQSSAEMALCAILHQILSDEIKKPLVDLAIPHYINWGSAVIEQFDVLWNILNSIISDPRCGELVIFLDALDECKEESRERLMAKLTALCHSGSDESTKLSNRVKVLVTSRPYAAVQRAFRNFQIIRLKAEDSVNEIDDDVKRVIDARIQRFADTMEINDDTRLVSLKQSLLRKADRTFLWVSLILDMLDRSTDCSYKELREIIEESNPSIDALYDKILDKANDPKKAQRMLHLVVGAAEPLTLAEINVAWAVLGSKDSNAEELRDRMFPSPERGVKEVCGLFVRVIDGKVVLVHQTAKEFLVRDSMRIAVNHPSVTWKHCLDPIVSSRLLVEVCLTYLLTVTFSIAIRFGMPIQDADSAKIPHFATPIANWNDSIGDSVGGEATERLAIKFASENPLITHAAQHWVTYFERCEPEKSPLLQQLALRIFKNVEAFGSWYTFWKPGSITSVSSKVLLPPLIVATYLDLDFVVKGLLDAGHGVNKQDHQNCSALIWAIRGKRHAVAKVLLDAKANTELNTGHGTPLHLAVRADDSLMVELLLQHGADPSAVDVTNAVPLHHARSMEVTELLLRGKGADYLESTDWNQNTPLITAATQGLFDVIVTLVNEGASLSARNRWGRSALDMAKYRKHPKLVEFLTLCEQSAKSGRLSLTVDL